jgi:ParB-like chromosome segregation protein Spo0J
MTRQTQPKLMLIEDIKVREQDKPSQPGSQYPPKSEAFRLLTSSVKKAGLLSPIFIDRTKICLSGHYRLWAAMAAKIEEVPVVVAESHKEVLDWFLS